MLLSEPLDGAGKRLSGTWAQRRPGPWPGLDSALRGLFPTVVRVAPLARFAVAACFSACATNRNQQSRLKIPTIG